MSHLYQLFGIIILILLYTNISSGKSGLRIIGGRDADLNKYPFVVSTAHILLSDKNISFLLQECTASVLTPVWTLTAAHCLPTVERLNEYGMEGFVVQVGTPTFDARYNLSTPNENTYKTKAAYAHPNFFFEYMITLVMLVNDVGLINTEEIQIKAYGRISAVDYSSLIGQEAVVVGSGMQFRGPSLNAYKWRSLKALDVITITCERSRSNPIYDRMHCVCVAVKCDQSTSTIFQGDSGGPLIHASGIIALVSAGEFDTHTITDKAQVGQKFFTALSPYLSWFRHIMN